MARNKQLKRYKNQNQFTNAEVSSQTIRQQIQLNQTTKQMLSRAIERFKLSARAYFRVLKVAQTIADLENADQVSNSHITEALQYRQLNEK
jgi:magnesium chelatase family protein